MADFRFPALVLAAALLSMPAAADEECKEISGEVFHRVRMALAPDAKVTVRLIEAGIPDGPLLVLGQTSFSAEGKQVPLSFTFQPVCDDLWLAVRPGFEAVIESGGKAVFATNPVQLMDQQQPFHPVEVFPVQ